MPGRLAMGCWLASAVLAPVAAQSRELVVGSARSVAGAKIRGSLSPIEHADGSAISLPVAIVSGKRPGPVVWIQAQSHGDEYGGARALQRVIDRLDPERMAGSVVAVMVANPAAFQGLQRVNPNLDDLDDLGTVFPGRDRFATQRVAAAITTAVSEVRPDFFLDLHTGGDRFRQLPFVFVTHLTNGPPAARLDSLALLFGIETIWRDTARVFPAGPTTIFTERGIPSFLVEVGGGQPIDSADVARQAGAVERFLAGTGVVPGVPRPLDRYLEVTGYRIVTNRRGGYFDALVAPGDRVRPGTALGTVRNVFGDLVETIVAPEGAMVVLGVSTYPAWASGGWLFELGTGVSQRGRH